MDVGPGAGHQPVGRTSSPLWSMDEYGTGLRGMEYYGGGLHPAVDINGLIYDDDHG